MKIIETLKYLDKSWSREDVLNKIKKGVSADNILHDFFNDNRDQIVNLRNSLTTKDKELLNNMQVLSNCESRLIKQINNPVSNEDIIPFQKKNVENLSLSKKLSFLNVSLIMRKWSNHFIIISLIVFLEGNFLYKDGTIELII